ncbi:hypothetical protein PsorP6_003466 [Peronosclerospora sorghi]|uniref:Uncharacterized protein n=1 Tax=Peronosclerospora sorghi TaxID=230839 RepID=A0ACC0VNZ6_9STRA|nr:hypothetical protein PsorP6_003466 [Peronosclerospora sorghi]
MSRTLETELQNHYRGLKRRTAVAISGGDGRCKYIFARTFLILCWNLMSRAGNAFSVCFEHMEFSEDALKIYFAHMKNYQMGERPRDARHVYANPMVPDVCPILALGVYWLCFPFGRKQKKLFPGNSQYDRFRKILQRCLELPEVVRELDRSAVMAKNLGPHSVRKGAATYASSGPLTAHHLLQYILGLDGP